MSTESREATEERLRVVIEMFEEGEAMYRLALARQFPRATGAEIDGLILEWLLERAGAEHGDISGNVSVRSSP